jgi:hypothetical protein
MNRGELQRLREAFNAGIWYGANVMESAWIGLHSKIGPRPYVLFKTEETEEKFQQMIKEMETNLDLIKRLKAELGESSEEK